MGSLILILSLLLLFQFQSANALAVLQYYVSQKLAPRQPVGLDTTWSKQDILTLVGVCIAIVTVIIGLVGMLVASPRLRRWLYKPYHWLKRRLQFGEYSHPKLLSSKN